MTQQGLPDSISQHGDRGILLLSSSTRGPPTHVYKLPALRPKRPEVSTHLYPALHRTLAFLYHLLPKTSLLVSSLVYL